MCKSIKLTPNAYESGERFYEDLRSRFVNVDWLSKRSFKTHVFFKVIWSKCVGERTSRVRLPWNPSIAVGEDSGSSFK